MFKNIFIFGIFFVVNGQLFGQSNLTKEIKILNLEIKELDLRKEIKEFELNKVVQQKNGKVFSEQELKRYYDTKDSLSFLVRQTKKEIINIKTTKSDDVEGHEVVHKKNEELTRADIKKMSTRDLKSRKAKISSKITSNNFRLKLSSLSAAEKAQIDMQNTKLNMKLDLINNELELRER